MRLALPPHAGDESRRSVRDANIMVSRCVLLLFLVVARGGTFVLENPKGSLLEIGGGRGGAALPGHPSGCKVAEKLSQESGPSWNILGAILEPYWAPLGAILGALADSLEPQEGARTGCEGSGPPLQ